MRVLIAVLGVCLLGVVRTASAQDTVYVTQRDTIYLPPNGYAGVTFCRQGRIEVWVRDPRVTGLMPGANESAVEWEGIQAHERTHLEQYQRYPTCELADRAWNDGLGRAISDTSVVLESEAYCEQARVFLRADAMDPRDLFGRLVARVLLTVPGASVHQVTDALTKFCPELGQR